MIFTQTVKHLDVLTALLFAFMLLHISFVRCALSDNRDTAVVGALPWCDGLLAQQHAWYPGSPVLQMRHPALIHARRLQSLLINFNEETVVNFFFGIGPAEASCACFAIATAAGAPTMAPLEATSTLPIHSSQAQADRALSCLSDPKYIGTAMWPSDPGMPDYAGYRGRGEAGQYGSVLSVTEPEWSHMHVGLVLFVYRLLHKVWDLPLLRVVGSGTGDRSGGRGGKAAAAVPVGGLTAVELALPVETLEALQGATAALGVVVVRVLDLLQGRGVGERKMWTPMEDEGGLSKRTRRQSAALLELERVAAIGCASFVDAIGSCLPGSADCTLATCVAYVGLLDQTSASAS